jgi:type IV pilus assembly protein PilM
MKQTFKRSVSVASALRAFFPPPHSVTLSAVGVDISDRSVKFVAFDEKRFGVTISSYGTHAMPEGVVSGGEIRDSRQLINILQKIRREVRREFVYFSLPEEHAYLFQTDVPSGATMEEIQTTIEVRLKENVPIPPSEVGFTWVRLPENNLTDGSSRISVAVYPTRSIRAYSDAFWRAGFVPRAIEIEGEAGVRSVVHTAAGETVMVLDFGRNKAGISIVQSNILVFTSTLTVGGDDLTNAIQKELSIPFEDAEQLKRQNGLRRSTANERVYSAILPTLSTLREEIERHYVYWQWHGGLKHGEAEPEDAIERIILYGGDSNLIGLAEYLAGTLRISVEHGDVWQRIAFPDGVVPTIPSKDALSYATAIGLAMRGIRDNLYA